jgi:hypothetical protein
LNNSSSWIHPQIWTERKIIFTKLVSEDGWWYCTHRMLEKTIRRWKQPRYINTVTNLSSYFYRS